MVKGSEKGAGLGPGKTHGGIKGMVTVKIELGGRRNCPEGHPLKTAHHLLKARLDCEYSDVRKERERKRQI